MTRCYSCFAENCDNFTVCPHCGSPRITEPLLPIHLYPGTTLYNGRYLIGRSIGSGGFGVVYKAWDTQLQIPVAIKEFFKSNLVTRAVGQTKVIINRKSMVEYEYRKKRFLDEARTLARLGKHPNITNVYEYFEENDTAYIVMELLKGIRLDQYLDENGGRIDVDFAVFITLEVTKALQSMHAQNVIHLDIAPDNLWLCNGGDIHIKVLDVGAAKLSDVADPYRDSVMKPGYSPAEQYDSSLPVGPWMDIYALGATLYRMVTGIKPDESTNRKIQDELPAPIELNPLIPENLSNAIMKALAVERHMRFRSVQEFAQALEGQRKVVPLSVERKRKRRRWIGGILAACLAITISGSACLQVYNQKMADATLKQASLQVWFSADEDSDEAQAMASIKEDFEKNFSAVTLELRAIPEEEYTATLLQAAQENALPSIFESSGLPDLVLEQCQDLEAVTKTEQFGNCLFLDQYDRYYHNQKQLPLAIEIPVAYIITNGASYIEYSDRYFTGPESFGSEVNIAGDNRYPRLLASNFSTGNFCDPSEFFLPEENTSPVLLSSSMVMNEVRETLINYEKLFAFYRSDEIHCNFIYEWSIGARGKNEITASERLLSWLLGNVYQTTLMITECSDGQIPVNPLCFQAKLESHNLEPIGDIYENFVFDREEGSL